MAGWARAAGLLGLVWPGKDCEVRPVSYIVCNAGILCLLFSTQCGIFPIWEMHINFLANNRRVSEQMPTRVEHVRVPELEHGLRLLGMGKRLYHSSRRRQTAYFLQF